MKICFTGDSIMLSPPCNDYWKDNELVKLIKQCDVRSTNLEMVLSAGNAFASTFCGGYWLTTDSKRIEDLAKYGFNHYSIANNHTMDYSYRGLEFTLECLDCLGFSHSGAGMSLDAATKASIVKSSGGGQRIAFISCTATCDDAARAGCASPSIPARPGVNMLRHSEIMYVTKQELGVIDSIAEKTCVNARFLKAVRMGIHSLQDGIHRLGRLQFAEGEKTEKRTYCNKNDLKRIVLEVSAAKKEAEYVVVGIHSHDIKGETDDTPDFYVEEFSRACIDCGADVVIGTGTHQLKGIEIYKDRPIFYSLGNFIFVSEHMDYAPSDYYERYGADYTASLDDIWLQRSKNNTIGLEFDKANYLSIVPILSFECGKISKIELIPIELGFCGGNRQKGFPYIATGEDREIIVRRLKELSEPYQTNIGLDGRKILVSLGA